MKTAESGFGWVDLVFVTLLIVGFVRGRKRGMSEELLDVIKWILIVAVGSFCYEPIGGMLSSIGYFSHLASYIATYIGIIIFFTVLFGFFKRHFGGKLLESDVFGSGEYYLGMCGGAVRYVCIMLTVMALLHARYYSPAEKSAQFKYQEDNFGSRLFPTPCTLQHDIFVGSFGGRMTEGYLPFLLIRPTAPEEKGLPNASIIRAREQSAFEILEKR